MTRNILLLSIEDLNDFIAPLGGHPDARTPNLTRLAARALTFERAYAAAPACSPARAAVLFGQAPWRTGVYTNAHEWSQAHAPGRRLSLIGHARDAGWRTLGAGKIFHGAQRGIDEDDWVDYVDEPRDSHAVVSPLAREGLIGRGSDYGPIAGTGPLYDERNAARLMADMTPGAAGRFWALGLFRPHLPFLVPHPYFDLLPARVAPAPGLDDETGLAELPPEALRVVTGRKLGAALEKRGEYNAFLRAYLAAIAYADDVLGRVLDHLDEAGLTESTLIVLWSDHGWQFGEKLCYRKFTLWERALRVPLMIAGPGVAPRRVGEPVGNLDIFATLLDVMGAAPKQAMDGQSLRPLFEGRTSGLGGDAVAVWGFPGWGVEPDRMARTIRTKTHRYTRYWNGGEELYDHRDDPFERRNLLHGPRLRRACRGLADELGARLPALAPAIADRRFADAAERARIARMEAKHPGP